MPWCPKCKTEYREGILICADCGTELVEELAKNEENTNSFDTALTMFPKESQEGFFAESLEEDRVLEDTKTQAKTRRMHLEESYGVYEESSKKAEEFKSGAFSLLLVGTIGLVCVILIFFDKIPLSMNLFSKYLILGVMGTLFLLFILMGLLSIKSYKTFKIKATEENNLTDNLSNWCRENISRDIIDTDCKEECEEEKYFRRTEKMKEMISHKFMNLDAAFLDSFVDDIYPEIFEK